MFTDQLEITFSAGNGGNGVVAWRREKYIPKGGPYGGDGGKGGSIIFELEEGLISFEHLRYKRKISAQRGGDGSSNNKKGKDGEDFTIKVPPGTIIKDKDLNEILFTFDRNSDNKFTACIGGIGGKGNTHFKSPTNQTPTQFTYGTDGQTKQIELELKIIADVGLVGMPNAGKSTFISKITNSQAKIADYPFTTIKPNIGVLKHGEKTALIADIPGLIENAHKNKGLGISFLKHIEKTNVLIYVIDISENSPYDPIEAFEILQNELKSYDEKLLQKPFLIALNKIDEMHSEKTIKLFQARFPSKVVFPISAILKNGIDLLVKKIYKLLNK
jgi:GTPase